MSGESFSSCALTITYWQGRVLLRLGSLEALGFRLVLALLLTRELVGNGALVLYNGVRTRYDAARESQSAATYWSLEQDGCWAGPRGMPPSASPRL